MSATDELRALLDERGVRWSVVTPSKTKWYSPVVNGPVAVSEWNDKLVLDFGYVDVTPKQAVEATLGRGTCNPIDRHGCLSGTDCPAWECSVCGSEFEAYANYCSNCGRKVVE